MAAISSAIRLRLKDNGRALTLENSSTPRNAKATATNSPAESWKSPMSPTTNMCKSFGD